MKSYQAKVGKLTGTDYHEVHKKAFSLYQQIKRKTRRRPYVRSAYFKKDKIFLELFWQHLFDKGNWRDRMRRLKYFACAIDLIRKTTFEPESKENPHKRSEILHRFAGITKENDMFFVQIKENKRTNQKFLISIFPFREK
ncbi:MAG TPA: hypothetical protein ENK99_00910 [Campylobacterales bacterium]|nr:hypothetical protein [Campylobacterales bacterium]